MKIFRKYNREEINYYWLNLHQKENDELKSVCFPSHTLFLNRFFDALQKFAIKRMLKELKIEIKDKRILDLGCGRGRWLQFYGERGGKVVGIDLSEEAVQFCKKKGFRAIKGNVTNLPFPSESFDIVNSITVLHHLNYNDQKVAGEEIRRVLVPGGIAILLECTYNDPSPHMFGRTTQSWQTLFSNFELLYLEAHYYCSLIRIFWKIPLLRNIGLLENLIVLIQSPLERYFLRKNFRKVNKKALQHLMVFKKK